MGCFQSSLHLEKGKGNIKFKRPWLCHLDYTMYQELTRGYNACVKKLLQFGTLYPTVIYQQQYSRLRVTDRIMTVRSKDWHCWLVCSLLCNTYKGLISDVLIIAIIQYSFCNTNETRKNPKEGEKTNMGKSNLLYVQKP